MKRIIFEVLSTPDKPAMGYGDRVKVLHNGKLVYEGVGSTCPNPFGTRPEEKDIPWTKLFGWIADGDDYKWMYIKDHHRFGNCLLINNGNDIPSRSSERGRATMKEIFIHAGANGSKNPLWRGSRGCMTIPQTDWPAFMANFRAGETGMLTVQTKKEA